MTDPLRADCSRCAALCCIAFAAEEMPGFAASKAAGEACPHLDRCGQCRIYPERTERGFAGCLDFECFGAGQFVVQALFGGRDWRDDPALLEPMLAQFAITRPAAELLAAVPLARERGIEGPWERIEADLKALRAAPPGSASEAQLEQLRRELRLLFSRAARAPA